VATGDDPFERRPVPDPTILTTEQLLRAVAAEREYVDGQIEVLRERLDGMDRASELRDVATEARVDIVRGIPSMVDEKIKSVHDLALERFRSVDQQFRERDIRSERESRDNEIRVNAAFAAQKEAASEQNRSNTLAITKSEAATIESINKIGQLSETNNANLANQIASLAVAVNSQIGDLKERVSRMESVKQGSQGAYAAIAASVAFAAVVIGIVVTIIALSRGGAA